MKALGWVAAYVGSIALSAMWSGYVLSVLWAWFIVTQFEGVPVLSIPAAIGLATVVGYLTKQDTYEPNDKRDQTERFLYVIGIAIGRPALALFFGYIVRGFL